MSFNIVAKTELTMAGEVVTALFVLAAVSTSLFVAGMYIARARGLQELKPWKLLAASWVMVAIGAVVPQIMPDSLYAARHELYVMGLPALVLGAIPAGVAFARLEGRAWLAFLPVAVGIAAGVIPVAYEFYLNRFVYRLV
jgi:hypothetical protein